MRLPPHHEQRQGRGVEPPTFVLQVRIAIARPSGGSGQVQAGTGGPAGAGVAGRRMLTKGGRGKSAGVSESRAARRVRPPHARTRQIRAVRPQGGPLGPPAEAGPPVPAGSAHKNQRGKTEVPIKYSSTDRAHCRPSRIAHTTSDCPRRMSPAANTFARELQ